jgi:hypothetical protein
MATPAADRASKSRRENILFAPENCRGTVRIAARLQALSLISSRQPSFREWRCFFRNALSVSAKARRLLWSKPVQLRKLQSDLKRRFRGNHP